MSKRENSSMKWSRKLSITAGIGIHLHPMLVILLASVIIVDWMRRRSAGVALVNDALIMALFGWVLLHELGHALTAGKYGTKTRDITPVPIGGLARLERMPEGATQEPWVALAVPAVKRARRWCALCVAPTHSSFGASHELDHHERCLSQAAYGSRWGATKPVGTIP